MGPMKMVNTLALNTRQMKAHQALRTMALSHMSLVVPSKSNVNNQTQNGNKRYHHTTQLNGYKDNNEKSHKVKQESIIEDNFSEIYMPTIEFKIR